MFGWQATHVQAKMVVNELHIMFHTVLSLAELASSRDCKAVVEMLHKMVETDAS
jgi:hypothetical protein